MSKKLILVLFLFTFATSNAQQMEYIYGQLLDATMNEPVPFASIRIKDYSLGVISNIDGSFKIPIRYKTLGDIIEISCMGFITKEILVSEFLEDKANIIILSPSVFELNEAVVSANIKKLRAKEIVKIAVNRIPQNYPQNDFSLVGYYRDFQIKNAEYFNFNEAIIQVYDKGFIEQDNFNNEYQVFSFRRNLGFENDSLAKQPYDYQQQNKVIPGAKMENPGGNEFYMLSIHDAIRNYQTDSYSYINNMATDYVQGHRFRLNGKTNYKDEIVYEIESYYSNKDYFSKGSIFISTDDFAILKLDYAVFKRKKTDRLYTVINQEERLSDGFNKSDNELVYHINTEYARQDNQKLFLNYISFYNKALVQRPAEFKSIFVIDLKAKLFKIRLNKTPVNIDNIKNNNIKISYKKGLLPIKRIGFIKQSKTFVVTPDFRKLESRPSLDYLFTKNDSIKNFELEYTYKNIKDSLGNKLDDRKREYIHQYREFFTQEIFPNLSNIPAKTSLMKKDLPLENKQQPICTDCDISKYWMNTPLKKIDR